MHARDAIEIDRDDLPVDLAGLEKSDGLLRRRDVIISVATDRARGVGRAEHGLDLVLGHAGLNLLEVDIDKDVSVPVDLGAATRNEGNAKHERHQRRP